MLSNNKLKLMIASALVLALIGCDVEVEEEGKLPKVDVDLPDVDVKKKEVTVKVPDVDVDMKEKQVTVPDVDVNFPKDQEINETPLPE